MPNTLVSLAGCGRNRHIPFRRRRDDTVCVTGLCSAASLGYEHEIFTAERRAAAACSGAVLLDASRLPRCRSISPVRTALSSKPAARE